MISAKEARNAVLANASFDRKVELYNQVTEIINTAVESKSKQFHINEEQHLVLKDELAKKGYTQTINSNLFIINLSGGPLFAYTFEEK
jgi:uncharacterized protein YdcH (DUF465 family)